MGYYSHYTLEYQGKETEEEIVNALVKITDFDFMSSLEDMSYEEMKWYDHEEDMLELSKIFPETLFILWREGEDDYRCKYYFKNGKSHLCVGSIVYEPFDVSEFDEEDNS